jgi:hypothetical protein
MHKFQLDITPLSPQLTNYRKDGYNWMRKKGATNTTRIDRLTLKVFGHDVSLLFTRAVLEGFLVQATLVPGLTGTNLG